MYACIACSYRGACSFQAVSGQLFTTRAEVKSRPLLPRSMSDVKKKDTTMFNANTGVNAQKIW